MTTHLRFPLLALTGLLALTLGAAEFREAISIWHAGHAEEMNEQLLFTGAFEMAAEAQANTPLLRIAAANPYRVTVDGKFAWYGPARGPKGFFRVDEVPLKLAAGRHTLTIECAGYNCANFYVMKQPSFLQAEVICGARVLLRTATTGERRFTAKVSPRVQKVNRYSHARPFGEAYQLPQAETAELPLEEQPAKPLIDRRAATPDFSIARDFAPQETGTFTFDEKKSVKLNGFVESAGKNGTDGFPKADLAYDLWDAQQRFELHPTAQKSVTPEELSTGHYALYVAPVVHTGFPMLTVRCEEPGEIYLLFDELLVNGKLKPWRSSVANAIVWRFDRPGEYAVETFEPYVFKAAAIVAKSGRFHVAAPTLRLYRNAESRKASFDSSDPALNTLFRAAEENFAQNAVDGFLDCPGRERANWNCDAFFTSRASKLLTGNVDQETLFLENFALPADFSPVEKGMIPMCYPSDSTSGNFIPSWAMFFVMQLEEYAQSRDGDPALVEQLKPRVMALVNYLAKFKNADGLLENLPKWVFVEWSKANDFVKGVNYPNNMLWAATLDAIDRLYRCPNLAEEAAKMRETIRKQSFDGEWFHDQALRQKDGTLKRVDAATETCQYYAFYYGTATKECYPALYRRLTTEFGPDRTKKGLYPKIWESAPFIGNFMRLDWLGREGFIKQQAAEATGYFGYMVDQTGTIWENANSADNGSCCHGFASHVAVFLLRDQLGLRRIDVPRKTIFWSAPKDSSLSHCTATLPAGEETLTVGWKRIGNRIVPEMKLPSGWRLITAEPVWHANHEKEMNEQLFFTGTLSATAATPPILRITSSNPYRVKLNGAFVWYGPARGPRNYFRLDEITLPVHDGANTLEIENAGNNCNSYYFTDQPSFLLAEVTTADGKTTLLKTATKNDKDTFVARRNRSHVTKVNRYSRQRMFAEAYDLPATTSEALPLATQHDVKLLPRHAADIDFSLMRDFVPFLRGTFAYDTTAKRATHWAYNLVGNRAGQFNGYTLDELDYDTWDVSTRFRFKPGTHVKATGAQIIKSGEYVLYDSPRNRTGFIGLTVTCKEPGELVVLFDELLTTNGVLNAKRNGTANAVTWRFSTPGTYEVEAFEPYTAKIIQPTVRSGVFEIAEVRLRLYRAAASKKAHLESSDARLEKIFSAAEETYAQNAVDLFTDCPGRERAGWNCDAFFTSRTSWLMTGNTVMERQYLDNFFIPHAFPNMPKGMFPMCYPSDQEDGNFIPSWALFMTLQLEEYQRFRCGDPAFVAAFRPKIFALIDYLMTFRNRDGLLEKLPKWVFVEWSKANHLVQDVNYPNNMVWASTLEAVDRLYGRPDLAQEAARVREEIRRQSWMGEWFCDNALRQKDGTLKLSGECTETCQYYAFYFGVADKVRYPLLYKRLMTEFGPNRAKLGLYPKIWPSNAFVGNYLRLEWLSREGRLDQVEEELTGFFTAMAERTGTLWEYMQENASCCHGFASHAAVSIVRDVIGLKSVDPVRKTIVFIPPQQPKTSKCILTLPTRDGMIRVGWCVQNGKIEQICQLPDGWQVSTNGPTMH